MKFLTPNPKSARRTLAVLPVALGLAFVSPAAEFIVGPGDYESLQAAIDAAADVANLDAENFVHLREPVLFTSARVRIGPEFGEARQLVIRPDPSVPGLSRVTIVSQNGLDEIVLIEGAGHVTLQDLDLVRQTTNVENLMEILNGADVVVERCRVGSDWPTPSLGEWSNLVIGSPRHVVVRNCVFFARLPGNLARGVVVSTGSALNHSVFLYNNVVADHGLYGVEIAAHGDSFVLLRNNVVFNHISLTPEPTAYHSFVDADVTLVTSHNTALAGAASVEVVEGNGQSIAGVDGFLRLERHEHIQTFREFEWKTNLGWNQNRNLFRLLEGGLLHNTEADAGVAVSDGDPQERDVAVLDDWEMDARPNGGSSRTDRGADQVRLLTVADVRVILPAIPSVIGASIGGTGSDEFEVVAVGPQWDFPEVPETMSGGEFRVVGNFTSVMSLPGTSTVLPNSTFFDGSPLAFVEWPSEVRYDSNLAMTVEAWVFREDPQRFETILSHNRSNSFWFGFAGPRLRFHRSGGAHADSIGNVPGHRWTHVAAAYDGSQVGFYIDGQPAGVNLLANAGAGRAEPLAIGGDRSGASFKGMLDEVRLWNVRRLDSEIRETMFVPITPQPGLVALFPSGGAWEAIAGVPGQPGAGVFGQPVGVVRQNIEIPTGLFPMTLNGAIRLWSEYLGAAQVAIRYDANDQAPDAIASLVYRDRTGDQNLYIGITGLRDVPVGRERSNSWVAVTFDADWSRDAAPRFGDFEVRGFLDGRRPELWLADGQGHWVNSGFLPGGNWDVAYAFPNEFGPPQMELRIDRAWLTPFPEAAGWNGTDGLMIGHYNVEGDDDNYLAPVGLRGDSPATWAPAVYIQNTNMPATVRMSGFVLDNNTAQADPVIGHRVELRDESTGEFLHTRNTDSDGAFSFQNVFVPPNRDLRLAVDSCADCLHLPTEVLSTRIQPLLVEPRSVVFPPPPPGSNRYARVTFSLRQPIGPLALASYTPTGGVPRLRLRDVPEKLIPEDLATRVTLIGTNLHQGIQIFFYSCLNLPPENLANGGGCELNRDYFEARIIAHGSDDGWVVVEVPHVPRTMFDSPWPGPWGWAVKDNWSRPGRVEWNRLGGFANTNFALRLPPYPLVFGFEFTNAAYHSGIEDFDGVFGRNAYVCLDINGECKCVMDPLYLLYFNTVFQRWVEESGGSCNGISATSLEFFRLELDAEVLELDTDETVEGVHFPAGFRDYAGSDYRQDRCGIWRPLDLAARIRVNHGVQCSSEFLQAVLNQMVGGLFSIEGDPQYVLDVVRINPSDYVIDMVPEIGEGHVVTPYAVVDGLAWDDDTGTFQPNPRSSIIRVYDNNHPEDTNRFIEINLGDDRSAYMFPRGDDIADDEEWRGTGIYAVPITVFSEGHTMPGLEEAAEALRILVFGAADMHCTNDIGGEWGWRADGSLVDRLQGARSLTPVGGPNTSTRSAMLVVPTTNPPPGIAINIRSNHYTFHAANGGRLLQLERRDGVPGGTDQMSVALEEGRLASMRYKPRQAAADFTARLGFRPATGQSAVFELTSVAVPGGAAVEFKALPEARGVELRNDTGGPVQPVLTIRWADGASVSQGTRQFGPSDVPAGAVQTVFIHDWPVVSQVRSEIDFDRDGTPDQVQIFNANPPPMLPLQAVVMGNQLILSWPRTTLSVYMEATVSLDSPVSWTTLSVQPVINGEMMSVTLPATGPQRFFRLRY